MELVANLWPIMDSASLIIQRFAARAYAVDADDSVIVSTLKALSISDYVLARQFPIPKRFTITTEHGTLEGATTPDLFNQHEPGMIEGALKALEADMPALQGIGFDSRLIPYQQRIQLSFPLDPYVVRTFLVEDLSGTLQIYSKR